MRLNKDKIKKNKLGFFFICFGLFASLMFMTKIFDLWTESVEIQAEVVKTFRVFGKHTRFFRNVNIEWTDLNGEIQKEGSLHDRYRLEVGDTYTIRVDAETQSRTVLTAAGSIIFFVVGLISGIGLLWIMKVFFGIPKPENPKQKGSSDIEQRRREAYDLQKYLPIIRCSVYSGKQVAGFKDKMTGQFMEVMIIQSDKDLEEFKARYGVDKVEKEY